MSDYFTGKIKLIHDNLKTLNKQIPCSADIQVSYDFVISILIFTVFSFAITTEIYNINITSKYSSPSETRPISIFVDYSLYIVYI